MLRRILATALIAGTVAGLFAAGLQRLQIVPLIAAAEVYEEAAAGQGAAMAGHHHAAETPAHAHQDAAAWEPAPGFERGYYTVLADLLAGIGFALLLCGGAALARVAGHRFDLRRGLLWGAAGFAAFALAPALGLPPELPGMASAGLAERQAWWLLTAIATMSGLGLVVFAKGFAWRALALLLLAGPHLVGAPIAEAAGTAGVPAELAARFVAASLVTAALFWLVLGAVSGWLFARLEPAER